MQRINDEEGVKKLCLETFQYFWFIPNRDHEKELLKQKVISMADVVDVCVKEGIIEHFETLIATLVKKSNEQDILVSSRQIVDALVDYIISLDSKIANGRLICYVSYLFVLGCKYIWLFDKNVYKFCILNNINM